MSLTAKEVAGVRLPKGASGNVKPQSYVNHGAMSNQLSHRDPRAHFVLASLFLGEDEGVVDAAVSLYQHGYKTVRQVSAAKPAELSAILEEDGLSSEQINTFLSVLKEFDVLPAD